MTEADVNRRISAEQNDGEAYDGVIDTFNPNNGKVHVTYDDGDEEWINPMDTETNWEFLPPLDGGVLDGGVGYTTLAFDPIDPNATPNSAFDDEESVADGGEDEVSTKKKRAPYKKR